MSELADLSTTDLSNVDLSNVDLSNVDLSNVDLSNVDLSNVDLSNVENPPTENPITIEINPEGGGLSCQALASVGCLRPLGELLVLPVPPPNPIVETIKQYSKIALLIGLNYVDFPEITLNNRIKIIDNVKLFLKTGYNYSDENILVLIEPSRENIMTTLNTIIGSSSLLTELIIYYSGYGNGIMKTDTGFCAETGIIDNLSKQILPADFAEIGQDELTPMLAQCCCKTVCIMDMCPYGNDDMLLKWGADVNNHVKVITLCESDSHNTDKKLILNSILREPNVPLN